MSKFLGLAVLALIVGLTPAASQAACEATGTVVSVRLKGDQGRGPNWIYMRKSIYHSHHYKVKTGNPTLAATAAELALQQTRVRVTGSAKTCPTEGDSRAMGKLVEIIVVP